MSERCNPAEWVRPELRRLSAYHLDLSACRYKLDQNEAPFEPPVSLKRQVGAAVAAAKWAQYPDFHADELRRALGDLHGWPAAGILAGNGSNELLDVCLAALAGPGREVLGVEPSFGLYRMMVVKSGATPHFVLSGSDLRLPVAALMAEVERDPQRVLLLCSPNNPTGDALSVGEMEALLAVQQGPVLLDNAYGEFCRFDYRPLLDRHSHLILLRTFSKAWALAGLRLGYLLADPRLVAELRKAKLPYNLGHAGVRAGCAVLAAASAAQRRIDVVVARRAQWLAMLRSAGFEVLPSEANFLLVRCTSEMAAHRLRDGLAERGIRVRDVGHYPALAGCLRISVGRGAALRATQRALAEIAAPAAESDVTASGRGSLPAAACPPRSESPAARVVARPPGVLARRSARIDRQTGETEVHLALDLDGGRRHVEVPNGFLGHMLQALATHAGFGLDLTASGDVQVDLHHTVEDIGIAFGEALSAALGRRSGVVRFGAAYAPLDEALARAVVDLSGRGFFSYSAPADLAASWVTAEFPLTLVADFFQAVSDRGRLTLHLEILAARNGHHAAEAAFKSVALALRTAVALRQGGAAVDVPSTKGTLTS